MYKKGETQGRQYRAYIKRKIYARKNIYIEEYNCREIYIQMDIYIRKIYTK